MKSSVTRTAILEAACSLFYQKGIKATSVEAILDKAGVARQSLYTHFGSKDGLVAEFLALRDSRWRAWMMDFVHQHGDSPKEKLLAVFDFLQSWFASEGFNGCAFINTAAEFSDPEHPFHVISAKHKALVLDDIEVLCRAAEISSPVLVAQQLALLMEGAIVTEQMTPHGFAAQHAKEIAKILIR